MIVVCPGCGRSYRIPDVGAAPRRVRCRACARVFATDESLRPVGAGPPAQASPTVPRIPPPAVRARRASPLVLVGDEDREFRELVRKTLESLGCRVEVTGDGEAAFRYAVAHHPDLMVLNVYMTRLLGVAVCEGVKGSPDLKSTRVALVGSVFKSDRFVRHPGNLYGADDYFEDVIPATQLRARLETLLGGGAAPAARMRPPVAGSPLDDLGSAPVATPSTAPGGGLSANGADEPIDPRSEIHRLARIMVSDLKIYHPEEFRRAVVERRFSETFREEMSQAKDLIGRRFPGMHDRMAVLTEALKEQIALERVAARRPSADSAP
jgi:predicted Zn finger-like uncharacterized protein